MINGFINTKPYFFQITGINPLKRSKFGEFLYQVQYFIIREKAHGTKLSLIVRNQKINNSRRIILSESNYISGIKQLLNEILTKNESEIQK